MIGGIDAPMNGATKLEFENWIKLATDNKINASNSWDVALIDYFLDLSVLREGDGINFQKASATLDGCVKIYTSRIDSAATETGRLLSGLALKKADAEDEEDEEDGEDGSDNEEDNVTNVVAKKTSKVATSLAKSFKLIRSKTIDTELFLDPLFKKTLTEFDEGGAKSLLMNMLHTDGNGRVLFDATGSTDFNAMDDSCITEKVEKNKKLKIDSLLNALKPEVGFENLSICPSIDSLIKITNNQESLEHILGQLQNDVGAKLEDVAFDEDFNDGGGNFGEDHSITNQGSIGKSFDFSKFYEEDNGHYGGPNVTMVRLFNENFIEESVEVSHLGDLDLNVLDYFDVISRKTWAGPEHWKISNLRKQFNTTERADGEGRKNFGVEEKAQRLSKSKDSLIIDFFSIDLVDDETLFKGGKNVNQPRSQWTSETYHLLPEDQLFTTKNFIYLSLKPTKLINTVLFGNKKKNIRQNVDELPSILDENYYATQYDMYQKGKNRHLDNVLEGDLQEIHESFGDNPFEMGPDNGFDGGNHDDDEDFNNPLPVEQSGLSDKIGFGSQLVTSHSNFKPNTINFARVAKRVDVKLLKDNLWESYNTIKAGKVQQRGVMDNTDDLESFKFTDIVNDMSKKYTPEKKNDLSTSFCFICLLHLANENGFAIESYDDYTDLVIHDSNVDTNLAI